MISVGAVMQRRLPMVLTVARQESAWLATLAMTYRDF